MPHLSLWYRIVTYSDVVFFILMCHGIYFCFTKDAQCFGDVSEAMYDPKEFILKIIVCIIISERPWLYNLLVYWPWQVTRNRAIHNLFSRDSVNAF